MSFNSKYTGAQVEACLDNIKNYSANDILEKLKTVDGSNSGLNADLLDGYHAVDFTKTINNDVDDFLNFTNRARFQTAYLSGQGDFCSLVVPTWNGNSSSNWYLSEIRFGLDETIKFRTSHNGSVTTNWKTLAFTDSNVASATKLKTARTIWGQSFDGTGDVSGTVKTMSGHGLHLAVSDDTYWQSKGIISTSWVSGIGDYTDILVPSSTVNTAKIRLLKDGNVGIGTESPSEKLHVEGGVRVNGQIIGAKSIVSNTTNGFFVGNRNDGLGVTDGGLLLYTYGKTPISFYINGERMRINSSGNVGIGTTNPQYKLDVVGDIHASGSVTQNSDINLKNKIKDILLPVEVIAEAPLFEFTYKSDKDKRIHVGTSAQYWVEKNNWFCKKQDNGYYDMEIQNLALASAISIAKEFKKYKEETESTISSMKNEIEELKQIVLNMNK